MNRAELIDALAARSDVSKATADLSIGDPFNRLLGY